MKPVRTLSSCPALLILGLLAAPPAPPTTYSIVTVADFGLPGW